MTKGEIFSQIPSYSGSAESMERMFERDKDELRELGITVEVLATDAFFDDELGYQIIPRDFFLPDISFTFEESIWLAIATNLLNDLAPEQSGREGLQKLLSFSSGEVAEILQVGKNSPLTIPFNDSLGYIWRSIREKKVLGFRYGTLTGVSERKVSPIVLTSRIGNWYLVALDSHDNHVKTFRIDRMSDLILDDNSPYKDLSSSFDVSGFLEQFKGDVIDLIEIRLNKPLSAEHPLIARSTATPGEKSLEPGSIVTLKHVDRAQALEMILWAGDAIEVLEPIAVREYVVEVLERIIKVNS